MQKRNSKKKARGSKTEGAHLRNDNGARDVMFFTGLELDEETQARALRIVDGKLYQGDKLVTD